MVINAHGIHQRANKLDYLERTQGLKKSKIVECDINENMFRVYNSGRAHTAYLCRIG